MSELVWGIKNGDLEQVKDIVEKKVSVEFHFPFQFFLLSFDAPFWLI